MITKLDTKKLNKDGNMHLAEIVSLTCVLYRKNYSWEIL